MPIKYQSVPLFISVAAPVWLSGELTPVPGGFVVTLPNGRILSVQPDSSYQDRDATAIGAWELCQVDPTVNVLRFNPSVPYAVVYRGV